MPVPRRTAPDDAYFRAAEKNLRLELATELALGLVHHTPRPWPGREGAWLAAEKAGPEFSRSRRNAVFGPAGGRRTIPELLAISRRGGRMSRPMSAGIAISAPLRLDERADWGATVVGLS